MFVCYRELQGMSCVTTSGILRFAWSGRTRWRRLKWWNGCLRTHTSRTSRWSASGQLLSVTPSSGQPSAIVRATMMKDPTTGSSSTIPQMEPLHQSVICSLAYCLLNHSTSQSYSSLFSHQLSLAHCCFQNNRLCLLSWKMFTVLMIF